MRTLAVRGIADADSSGTEKVGKTTPVWVYCIFGVLGLSLVAIAAAYVHNKSKGSNFYSEL